MEIEEMQEDYCKVCKEQMGDGFVCEYYCKGEVCRICQDNCEVFYNAGYRKQFWHKVKDGDLPEVNKLVLCLRNESYDKRYTFGRVNCDNMWDLWDDETFFEELDTIIAWTEIPEYKE